MLPNSDRMLVVPVVIDLIPVPSVIQDIHVLQAPTRDLDEIVAAITKAIANSIGQRAAREEKAAEVAKRIEINAATYIEDAIQAQRISEKKNRRYGSCWYLSGFMALVTGLVFVAIGLGVHASVGSNWADFGVTTLKSILVIGLLGACSKYAFSLGKS